MKTYYEIWQKVNGLGLIAKMVASVKTENEAMKIYGENPSERSVEYICVCENSDEIEFRRLVGEIREIYPCS
jgi:hypothetical protein